MNLVYINLSFYNFNSCVFSIYIKKFNNTFKKLNHQWKSWQIYKKKFDVNIGTLLCV